MSETVYPLPMFLYQDIYIAIINIIFDIIYQ